MLPTTPPVAPTNSLPSQLAPLPKTGKNVTSEDANQPSRRILFMTPWHKYAKSLLRLASFLFLLTAVAASAQDKDGGAKSNPDAEPKDVRLTIVVTGGDEKKPVDSASVYIRYVEEHKHGKDKKIEMNLKTNQSGVCHVPVIPPGKFAVQVIADGWKTYGEYYDLTQNEQTINISLVRPPKWY